MTVIQGELKDILLELHRYVGERAPSNANTVTNLWKAAQTADDMLIDYSDEDLQRDPMPEIERVAESLTSLDATPSARVMAEEHNVALHKVVGTGQSGRVTKEDVATYLRHE